MIFSFLHWNPKREFLLLPLVRFPIMWYGLFFALGFLVGYFLLIQLLKRYFLEVPYFTDQEILEKKSLFLRLKTWFTPEEMGEKKSSLDVLKHLMEQDKTYHFLLTKLGPGIQKQAAYIRNDFSFTSPKTSAVRWMMDRFFSPYLLTIQQKSVKIADKLLIYVTLGTILGAKCGHFLFYEHPKRYLLKPWEMFTREGFASHGAVLGILLTTYLFSKWVKKYQKIAWLTLLDLLALPAAFVAGCIRLGNFFNQEILGRPTALPWAIIFENPMDGSLPLPRHPVQLYEAVFYFFIFFLLKYLTRKPQIFNQPGKILGLLLTLVFSFRFIIEFFKEEQSAFFSGFFTMGQLLSIPLILGGAWLLWSQPKWLVFKKEQKTKKELL